MKLYEVNWQSVYSGTPPSELERLQYYCSIAPDQRLAIEIGTHEGASAAILAQWFETVICIDPWGDHELLYPSDRMATFAGKNPGGSPHFLACMGNLVRLGLFDRVIPIVNTPIVLEKLPSLNAGLIFVDDGHVYSACSKDIKRSLPHLHQDGLLVCHDYCRPGYGRPPYNPDDPNHSPVDPYIGVQQAVDEAIIKYNLEVVDHFEGIVCLKQA